MSLLTRYVLLTPPAVPVASVISSSRIDLTWTAVLGAISYRVYRGGVLVDSPTAATSSSTGLTSSTLYSFQVSCVDSTGYEGPKGTAVAATTLSAADTTAPTVPGSVASVGISNTTIRTTWAASTDSGGSGLAGYRVYRATTVGGTYSQVGSDLSAATLTFDDASLSAGTTRFYKVLAFDVATNASAQSPASTGTTTGAPASWILPSTHTVAAKLPMRLIFPRPNAETNAKARHRRAYYDGVNPIQYKFKIVVGFGRPPFNFTLNNGPPGMLVDSATGEVTWTPAASISSAFACDVTVLDQDSNPLPVLWSVVTSSSTADFIFISPSGSNGNSGAFAAPKQTLAGVFGSTFAATANPGAIAYLRTGTYSMPQYSDNSISAGYPCFDMHLTRKPAALIGYPGETATLDATTSRFSMGSGGADFFMQDFICNGVMPGIQDMKMFYSWGLRQTFQNVDWTNAGAGTVGGDNATMFHTPWIGGGYLDYLAITDCAETGRTPSGANNYGFCSLYSRRYFVIENCSFIGSAHTAFYLKGDNSDGTLRSNWIEMTNAGGEIASEGFDPGGATPANIEWCYNYIKANGAVSYHALESPVINLWSYRNTRYGHTIEFDATDPSAPVLGPYTFENEVIVTNVTPRIETGGTVSISGTECHGGTAAGIVNPTTLALTGTFRTNFLYTRGAEIG